ncbi:MAG: hypothetical protein A3K19_13785 [Lentisphaerae bacterium RIFOXYB12_FULL_65_16]|nr:MAG: hypothetical protein A3K18_00090 [Lentisphaerae bacterium RIFOXYA12_64_32]OGV84220.1 MAG: hypothetical protein A3K19_13785 [Lentisphaerae bacterium RIFOXYB12_FULL_65_16]
MSRLYWLLNVVLMLGAVVASAWAVRQAPDARWSGRAQQSRFTAPPQLKGAAGSAGWDAAVGKATPQPVDVDVLWRQTLFNPARTEDLTKGDAEAVGPSRIELELIGILQFGDVAAAIILDKQMKAAPRTRTARVGSRTVPAGGAEPSPEEVKTQHVYKLNDPVGNTGYVVKEIRLDEVVLTRGDEERVLRLQSDDAESVTRRKVAADDDTKREEEAKKEDAKREKEAKTEEAGQDAQKIVAGGNSSMPPPPPPPPPGVELPTPGGDHAKAPAPGALSAEERILRAKELRERLLERRRNATPQTTVPAATQ